jgi:hypothetical protein
MRAICSSVSGAAYKRLVGCRRLDGMVIWMPRGSSSMGRSGG